MKRLPRSQWANKLYSCCSLALLAFVQLPVANQGVGTWGYCAEFADDLLLLRLRGFGQPTLKLGDCFATLTTALDLFLAFAATHSEVSLGD